MKTFVWSRYLTLWWMFSWRGAEKPYTRRHQCRQAPWLSMCVRARETSARADEKCMRSETKEQMRRPAALSITRRQRPLSLRTFWKLGLLLIYLRAKMDLTAQNVTRRAKAAECQPVALTTRVKHSPPDANGTDVKTSAHMLLLRSENLDDIFSKLFQVSARAVWR